MDLLRHWRRRTFGAAIGALIAPAAIVAATLAVGVGGGGLGGLRSIGQTISGPRLPSMSSSAATGPATDAGRLLARVSRQERRSRRSRSMAPAATVGPGTQVAAVPGPQRGGRPERGRTGPPAVPPPADPNRPEPTQPPVVTPAPPSPPPTPSPSPLRQVGDGVKQITDQVPVAGQPAGNVVDLLVDTVDGLSQP